jgi:hypothetical protein
MPTELSEIFAGLFATSLNLYSELSKVTSLATSPTEKFVDHHGTMTTNQEDLVKLYTERLSPALDQLKIIDPLIRTKLLDEVALISHVFLPDASYRSRLQAIYDYEKHYLELIKDYKEEIKFANTVQEDLRRERSQFFTQTLKEVINTLNSEQVEKATASKWIQELVNSYTVSLDLSSDLAKTHIVDLMASMKNKAKEELKSPENGTRSPEDLLKETPFVK